MAWAFMATVVFAGFVFAQSEPTPTFPYCTINPDTPFADQEPVVLQELIGVASNSCMAPTFTSTSFSLTPSPIASSPLAFTITVHYKEIPLPSDKLCPMVYNPVHYGPIFKLGLLKAGRYSVVDNGKTVGTFTVAQKGAIASFSIKGSIHDDPYPTKRASLPIVKAQVILKKRAAIAIPADAANAIIAPPLETPVDTEYTGTSGEFAFNDLSRGFYTFYCTHANFNGASQGLYLTVDTTISITMLDKTAFATVAGTVSEITRALDLSIIAKPIVGCTVVVQRPIIYYLDQTSAPITDPGITPIILKTVTNTAGAYEIPKIPIAYNGERWTVRAYKSGFTGTTKYVTLSNMQRETVNFESQQTFLNSNAKTIDGVLFSVATDKSVYAIGEGVSIRYSITNTSTKAVTFSPFSGNCEYDLIAATTAGKQIFRLSDNSVCLATLVAVTITVNPGETVTKTFPTYYLPDLGTSVFNNKAVAQLMVSARLRGSKYDSTEVPVSINVQPRFTAIQPISVGGEADRAISCSASRTTMYLNLPTRQTVALTVYTLDGKVDRELTMKSELSSGSHLFAFNKSAHPAAVYIVQVNAGTYSKAFKIFGAVR
jgi:hypothetical protein